MSDKKGFFDKVKDVGTKVSETADSISNAVESIGIKAENIEKARNKVTDVTGKGANAAIDIGKKAFKTAQEIDYAEIKDNLIDCTKEGLENITNQVKNKYEEVKKKPNFDSIESLGNVQNVINEAGKALDDPSRSIELLPASEVVGGAVGVGAGGAIGFAALYFGGSVTGLSAAGISSGLAAAGSIVGGGMAAGIGVIAAPAVILGGAGVGAVMYFKNKKLDEAKQIVYKDALAKQTAIIEAIKNERDANMERIAYLNGINVLLQAAIKDLESDLEITN